MLLEGVEQTISEDAKSGAILETQRATSAAPDAGATSSAHVVAPAVLAAPAASVTGTHGAGNPTPDGGPAPAKQN